MKQLLTLCLLFTIWPAQAKTSLYGQANGYSQWAASDVGSTLQLETHLSEFGFRGDSPVATSSAFFDLTVGLVDYGQEGCCPQLLRSELGLSGDKGVLTLFYGDTPLSRTNHFLTLMHRDPDALTGALGYRRANNYNLAVGLGSADGLGYRTPLIANRLQFEWALIPTERVGGEHGFSFAGHYGDALRRVSLAMELNGTRENTQLVRLIGDLSVSPVKVGAGLQWASSSLSEARSIALMAFTRIPVTLGSYASTLRWLVTANRLTDQFAASHQQYYTSLVQEIGLTDKVSVYAFVELDWPDRQAERLGYAGLGLNMDF
ncbi:hypothetical protein [Reinekea sp.]|jgi:hypothetical protein|uniref:hypothetical protein n=1 Tax=Reinekea sp. TaxID=1970455 RepID=UPI002A8026AF|nr:hypothetical protein [Reinekea sp.]